MSVLSPEDTFVVRDRMRRVAPLGVRFWDVAGARFVAGGLVVRHSWANGTRSREAVSNASGVYGVADLPGLHDVEFAVGDAFVPDGPTWLDEYWQRVASLGRRYVVSVRDPERRFLPFTFEADLPFRGLFELPCESPPHSPLAGRVGALPVFSTAWRPIPAGATVARAQLVDAVTGKPAASALLEVTVAGATFRGLADARGNVVVVLPYPEPAGSIGSPPGGTAVPFTQQRWPVTVACSYGRVGSPPDPPDLCHVLEQPPAALDVAGPLELAYGRELVLRAAAGSEVHVTPAVSPP